MLLNITTGYNVTKVPSEIVIFVSSLPDILHGAFRSRSRTNMLTRHGSLRGPCRFNILDASNA
jgi:hypothetical protein